MRQTYAIALVREYDVKPFAGLYTLETAEFHAKTLRDMKPAIAEKIVVLNMESFHD